jgi:RHS repeat-associated protein
LLGTYTLNSGTTNVKLTTDSSGYVIADAVKAVLASQDGVTGYYVYPDQVDTPRIITRPSDKQMIWRWDQTDPFGAAAPNQNPSGLGSFAYNPRFPGQLYDQEDNLYYNYFRNYEPTLARYVQSDPIGMEGGLGTYTYVDDGPLVDTDPKGQGRFTKQCGPCTVTFDSDQWKGAHTHWQCPGQPQGCIKKDGTLCDGSGPPPADVKDCLQKWGRIPPDPQMSSCGPVCKNVIGGVVVGGLIIGGFCLAGPPGAVLGGIAGAAAQ